jgi:hypothetical protein
VSLPTRRYRRLLDACAELVALPGWTYRGVSFFPGEWLEGLVLAESRGNPSARLYEPHQDRAGRRDAASDGDTPDQDDGMLEDDKSYGLMQVMGYNIRELCGVPRGTAMRFGFALLPITNVALGLRVLIGELSAVGGDVARALARYNGGPTGDDGSPMRLQGYVDRIYSHALVVRDDRVAEASEGLE